MNLHYIPNTITILRIVLSFFVLYSLFIAKYQWALYLFLLAGASDALDGFLARRYGWFTRFGSIADPIADKILLVSSLLALAYGGYIPVWLVGLIIARDLWVALGAFCYYYWISTYEMAPTLLSKANTFIQILFVVLILINLSFSIIPAVLLEVVMYLVLVMNLASWVHYTWVWGRRAWEKSCV